MLNDWIKSSSERNIVVRDALVELLHGRGRGGRLRAVLSGARHGHGAFVIAGRVGSVAAATAAAAAEQHDIDSVADYLGDVLFLPFFVLIAPGFDPAFQKDLFALQQVVGDTLGLPRYDVVPIGDVFPLTALLVLGPPIRG